MIIHRKNLTPAIYFNSLASDVIIRKLFPFLPYTMKMCFIVNLMISLSCLRISWAREMNDWNLYATYLHLDRVNFITKTLNNNNKQQQRKSKIIKGDNEIENYMQTSLTSWGFLFAHTQHNILERWKEMTPMCVVRKRI